MIKLSYSGISDFRSCPYKHFIRYVLRRVPRKTGLSLRFGSAWHVGMEHVHEGTDAAVAAMRDASAELDEVDVCKLVALLSEYTPPVFEVVDIERPFEMRIKHPDTGQGLNGVIFRGRIDKVVRNQHAELGVLEHKTTSSKDIMPGGDYWRAKRIDSQHPWYRLAVPGVEFAAYDVVRRPSLKPSSKDGRKNGDPLTDEILTAYTERVQENVRENMDTYFGGHSYHLTDEELAAAQRDLYQWAERIRHAYKHNVWPRNPGSCAQYSGCEYLGVCTGCASLDDDALYADKKEAM